MPRSRVYYYRRQADLCLRLSLAASDDKVCAEMFEMAQRYKVQANALEREPTMAGAFAQASSTDHAEHC